MLPRILLNTVLTMNLIIISTAIKITTDISIIIVIISDFNTRTFELKLINYVRFEVLTAVTMKNGVLLDVTPCGSCRNRRFGGTWRLLHQDDKIR
jgi:hypothetical protein